MHHEDDNTNIIVGMRNRIWENPREKMFFLKKYYIGSDDA